MKDRKLEYIPWIENGDYIYYIPYGLNFLGKYSKKQRNTEKLYKLPNSSVFTDYLCTFLDIKKSGDKLILVPTDSKNILIFDTRTEEFSCVGIPNCGKEDPQCGYFSKGYIFDKYVYLIGLIYPCIIRINLDSNDAEKIYDFSGICNAKNSFVLAMESIVVNEKIYVITQGPSVLVEYDMKTGEHACVELDNEVNSVYKTLAYDGENIIVTRNARDVIKINNELGISEKRTINRDDSIGDKQYRYSVVSNNKMYIFSCENCPIVVVDLDNLLFEKYIWNNGIMGDGFEVIRVDEQNSKNEVSFCTKCPQGVRQFILDTKLDKVIEYSYTSINDRTLEYVKDFTCGDPIFINEKFILLDDYLMLI